ncbi:MAG: PHP domain-containing protein [Halanaerobiales bacterium]
MVKRYECDLHCHTDRSDGNDTPKMLIDNAAALGMRAVAITDHDIDPPEKITVDGQAVNIRDYARQQGLNLLLGCEFSTDTYVSDVHIIGYEMDWNHSGFKRELKRAEESKSEAYKKLTELLTERGMPIDYENEILKYTDQEGQIHYREPEDVQKKFIFEKMAEKGYAPDWGQAKIMVTDDSELHINREKIDPVKAIELIHECGGIAVLAHPYLIDKKVKPESPGEMTRGQYINRLIENGLDGIEARYTYNKTSYKGSRTIEEIEREVKELYGDRLFISGGSDYHAGEKKGVKNPRQIGEAGISHDQFREIFSSIIDII